jgi:acyl transferase domain-containing protein/acyl carrier protein
MDSRSGSTGPAVERIREWLVDKVAETVDATPMDIDPALPFDTFGVTSTDAVSLSGQLEEWLDLQLEPTLLYAHPTINDLAAFLSSPPGTTLQSEVTQNRPEQPPAAHDPVCVVGMACRLPAGADTPALFWENLANGVDAAAVVPADRWDADSFYSPDPDAPGRAYTRTGAFVHDLAAFDTGFFGISPREALRMDPRQRLLLETSWAALEDAGLAGHTLRRSRTGVFVGMMADGQYTKLQLDLEGDSALDDPYLGLGSAPSVTAGRIAYHLDLRGPCLLVDTACSSALVATHLAAESLLRGETDVCLVGGVSATLHPDTFLQGSKMRMLAPDGRCKTFDAAADGFLMGEGCGVVVLERRSDALARGHQILAVLRGSAMNQDGMSNGLTAPNGQAQVAVIQAALDRAGCAPHDVDFVEAHGSGTLLGDSIELTSLQDVFGPDRAPAEPLIVGAVKTNIGHLIGAAGIAGLIKTILALRHDAIPANLHCEKPSDAVAWDRYPVTLPATTVPWPVTGRPRVAGVSSFGWSGTNAHLLVEEAPPRAERGKSPSGHVLLLSARSEAALPVMARELLASLGSEPEMEVGDVAFTTQIGRKAFDFRATIPCRDLEGARAALEEFAAVPYAIRADRRRTPAIALLLPGSGEQYVGMGRALYETEQVFRDAIGECAGTLAEPLGLDLREVIYPADPAGRIGTQPLLSRYGEPSAEVDSPLFQRTDVAHAAVFAVDYACAKLWQHYGVSPTMLLGYSLGEYVAACLAGVFSLEDALRLVVRRAQLLRDTPSGAMLAVAAPVSELQTWLGPELSLAARNGPMTSVVSGTEVAVEALCTRLTTRGVAHRRVPTAHAMHSSLLEPMRADVSALVASVPMRAPRIPFVSNVTGTWITPEQACDPDYWAAHMCRTVLFASGVTTLAEAAADVLLETGPGQLASLATQTLAGRPDAPSCLSSMPGRLDRTGGREFMLRTAARLWTGGVDLDWSNTYAGWLPRVVSLPTYPFERQRFWPSGAAKAAHHPGSGSTRRRSDAQPRQSVREWLYEPQWRKSPSVDHAQPEGPYLIFGDELGLGSQLTAKLADIGRWVTVRAGAEFAEIDHDTFEIRPGVVADYMRLMERLAALGRIPRTVVHLWSVTGESEHTTSPERIRALQRLGFESVLHLGRALAPVASAGARLLIVTDGAQRVDGGERVDPGKATIVGPCLSLAQEYPGLACRIVDLPAVSSTGPASQDHLFDELRWPGSDTAIAYRAGERYVEEYVPVPWDGTASGNVLRDGGTYLITGGLGNMGLLIARHIATRVRGARLVLVGRTGLPPRETWSTLLEDTSDPALAHRVARVRDLTATGAEVLVVAADVADVGDMRRLVERVRREIGPINGVVHAAGITAAAGFAPVADMAQEITDGHFAAKVFGTLALSEALANEPLDFCVLQSSISAVLGGLGFAAYAGANAFLDRFAQAHDHTGRLPWRSVAWDTWQATISETAGEGIGDSMAVFSMTPEEGLQVFDQVIASGGGRTVVSTGSLGDRVHKWTRPDDPFEGKAEVASAPLFARPQIPETYIPAKTDYERRLAGLWRVALGIDGVGVNDNFFELGGNSLVGTQLVSAIRKEFQTSVPVVALFEAPTVRAMGKYLMSVGEQPVIEEPGPAAQMSERVPQVPAAPHDGIAIIGMAGRFPGAMNTRDFWENLSNGVESIRFFTEEELVEAGVPAEVVSQPNYIKARPVLDGIDLFDAEFFGYSPWEARLTDPQHRIFLESVWEALETAGYAPRSYPGSIGVFAGTNISTYIRKLYDDPDIAQSINDYQVVMSNDKDALTTTASYKLNLRGPSVAVQTFCSTSMPGPARR